MGDKILSSAALNVSIVKYYNHFIWFEIKFLNNSFYSIETRFFSYLNKYCFIHVILIFIKYLNINYIFKFICSVGTQFKMITFISIEIKKTQTTE